MSRVVCPRCAREVAGGKFCPGCGASLDDALVGRVLGGRLKLTARLQVGPVFTTYHAEHTSGGATFAVKVLNEGPSADDGARRRFLEAAGVSLSFPSAHLFPVREMAEEVLDEGGIERRIVYAVTDAPAGGSLLDRVQNGGPLSGAGAAALAESVLAGLESVHGAGVVHGDIHPGCLFEGGDGGAWRLADAGLSVARVADRAGDPSTWGSDGGRWLAPEQIEGKGAASAAADLHAVALLFHFAVHARAPRQADSGAALVYEIQKSFPPPLSEQRPDEFPAELDTALDAALSKRPEDRPASAAKFRRALAAVAPRLLDEAPALLAIDEEGGHEVRTAAPVRSDDKTPPGGIPAVGRAGGAHGAVGSGDATVIASRASLQPSAGSGSGGDATVQARRPPAPPPGRGASTAPPHRAADPPPSRRPAEPPPSRSTSRRETAPPQPALVTPPRNQAEEPRVEKAPPPAAVAAAAPVERKGRWWSVGGPVASLTIVLLLATGGLYGFVWAGYLDGWSLPGWIRRLTAREALPTPPDPEMVAPQERALLFIDVDAPRGILLPMSPVGGETATVERFGSWKLLLDPAENAPATGDEEGAVREKVFASGDLHGPVSVDGVLTFSLRVPSGRYRAEVVLGHGSGRSEIFTVRGDDPNRHRQRLAVKPLSARFLVKVIPAVGTVTLTAPSSGGRARETSKGAVADDLLFGAGTLEDPPLFMGTEYTLRASAPGFEAAKSTVVLLQDPQVVELRLRENAEGRIALLVAQIEKDGRLPAGYEGDPILGESRVKVELARVSANHGDWTSVETLLNEVEEPLSTGGSGDGGASAEEREARRSTLELIATVRRRFHEEHLLPECAKAAAAGDSYRVEALRKKMRVDLLPASEGQAAASRFAETGIDAWLHIPAKVQEGAPTAPQDEDFRDARRLVERDLPALTPEARRLKEADVAHGLVQRRVAPALERGDDIAAQSWLDLARTAYPAVEKDLHYRRFRARIALDAARPDEAVRWILGEDGLRNLPNNLPAVLPEDLPGDDRLRLARALRLWGYNARASTPGEAGLEEARKYWTAAWNTYGTLFDRNDRVRAGVQKAALLEGVEMGFLVRGEDSARVPLEKYMALYGKDASTEDGTLGDPRSYRAAEWLDVLRAGLIGRIPAKAQELGYVMVKIQGGRFRVGVENAISLPDESSVKVGGAVPVGQLRARDWAVPAFWAGVREVSRRQYEAYLVEMENPEKATLYRHPQEPAEKMRPGARRPQALDTLDPDEPVRGVDFYDAYACAKFMGGRLPTEVEWEMMARWAGRIEPAIDGMADLRRALGGAWSSLWPLDGRAPSVLDRSPMGVIGVYGGVAEWCLDPWSTTAVTGEPGLMLTVNPVPPLPAGPETLMVLRGASYFHRPPGDSPGPSPVPPPAPAATDGGKVGEAPVADPTRYRAMDLTERRALAAGQRVRWVGFRVVFGP